MPNELRDFKDLVARKHHQKVHESRSEIRQIAQATVPLEKLTKSPEWDFFLSIVQAKIEELEVVLSAYQQALATSMSFDHASLANDKAGAMRTKVQIDTLQAVLELPKQLIDMGEKAKLELVQYDDE